MEATASKKRIAVIGCGAAGIASAWMLSRHPEKFDVDVYDRAAKPGGVAESRDIGGGLWINNGVQGGAPSYAHTFKMMEDAGIIDQKGHVNMKFSFGKGKDTWNNIEFPSELQRELHKEIESFSHTVKTIKRFEFIFAFTPISKALKMFGYSDRFAEKMIYPILALFFGTGNQTPHVPAAVIARIFEDPNGLRFFNYNPDVMITEQSEMFAFPNFDSFFERLVTRCTEKSGGATKFLFNTSVLKVTRDTETHKVTVYSATNVGNQEKNPSVPIQDRKVHAFPGENTPSSETVTRVYDQIIFATDAETVLKILDQPTFWESRCLGHVHYYNDVTVTHEDTEYMNKYYDNQPQRGDQYYIHQWENDPAMCDMSFNLTNYQPQLKNQPRQIYQTIFLNEELRSQWTINEIQKDKILLETWWRQMGHRWDHFALVLPIVNRVQGTHGNTWYAGSWTMVNTFEVALISGFAAARRCGADYPFMSDEMAKMQFNAYMIGMHAELRWEKKQRDEWNEEVRKLKAAEADRYKNLNELNAEAMGGASQSDEEAAKSWWESAKQKGGNMWDWLFSHNSNNTQSTTTSTTQTTAPTSAQ